MSERTDVAAPVAPAEPMPTTASGPLARFRSFARRHKEFKRFSKFAIVGALGFIIDSGTVNLLLRSRLFEGVEIPLPVINVALTEVGIVGAFGFIFAVTSNFIWNRLWTYPDSRSKPLAGQLVTFFFVNAMGLLIRLPIMEGLSRPFGRLAQGIVPSLSAATAEWLGINAALVLAVIVVMFWNFFVNRYWTYNDID